MSTVQTRNLEKLISNTSLGKSSFQSQSKLKNDLVIVDSKVDNYQQLVSGVRAGFEVIAIYPWRNAIVQITEILSQRSSINSLHIVSHGQEAAIQLGRAELNIDNLESYSSQLKQWGKALSESGSILLYGCNIAAGESGIKFVQKISDIIGVNIAASNNLTGSAALGGDWELQIATGQINSELAFEKEVLESYTSVLATLVTEDFKKPTVIGPWIYGVGNTITPNPGLTAGAANTSGVIPNLGKNDPNGFGALQLTSNAFNQVENTFGQAAFLIYNNPIAATGGLRVTFDFFAYNRGTVTDGNGALLGADGISFFLIDGTATPTKAGGFGGSLGYAQNTTSNSAGILGGYLGVGLDEFGNFSNTNAGRINPPGQGGFRPDAVGIRGSESTSYNFLSSIMVPGGVDNAATTIRSEAKRRVQITLFPATSATPNRLSVAFDLDNSDTFGPTETLIDIPNLALINGAVPPTFKFGFAASTGGNTNVHEINNVLVETIDPPTLVADVSIVKKGPQFAKPGGTITYSIISTNNGPSDAKDVLIQDPLPAGLTFLSADNGGTFNSTTRTVIWPVIPTLANTASVTRTITVTVPTTLTSLTNTVYSSSSTFDPDLTNNNSSQPISQVPTTITNALLADVVTTKTGAATATAGRTVSYTIATRNNGPDTADNVTITDSIIPGLTGVTVSDGGTYNTTTGIVTFPAVSLTNTTSTTRNISFIAPANLSVSNTARSTSSTLDPTLGNNDGTAVGAIVTTNLTPSADVITTKTGLTNAAPGSIVSYTIATQNNGPSTADNVTITDSIIPNLTGVSVSDGGTYNTTTGIVTFPAVSLTNTAITNRTISFIAPARNIVSNTARSTSSTPDPTPGNNDGTAVGAIVTTTLTPTPTPTPIIIPPNQPPVTANTQVSLPANSSRQVTGLGATDPDGTIASFTINTLPPIAQGVLFLGDPANGGIAVTPGQVLTPAQIGQLFFRTTGEFTGTNFSYSATDNRGASSSATASFSATASPIPTPNNQPPVATNANLTIPPNTTTPVPGLGGTDPDGSIASFTINSLPPTAQGVLFLGDPANGGIAVTPGQVLTPAQIGQLFFRTTGEFTGANFTYSATDNSGATSPATATVAALPPTTPPNQPPVARNANLSIPPNSTTPVPGLGGTDPDGSIASFTINSLPPTAQGVLFIGDPANGGIAVTPGQVLTPSQIQQLFFRTTGEFTGANFTYSATDNQGLSSPATATVATLPVSTTTPTPTPTPVPTPNPNNQPPVTTNVNFSIPPSSSTRVTGLGGTDPDGSIASFTINTLPPSAQGVLFLGDPANGGIAVTPGQILTPAQIGQLFFRTTGEFTGTNFSYSATDNQGAISPVTATVAALLPTPNQPPVAANTNFGIAPNSSTSVTGLSATDPDGSIASFTINTLPPANQGVLFLGVPPNNSIPVTVGQILTPEQVKDLFFQSTANFTGGTFTYSATDNLGAVSPGIATVAAILEPVVSTPTPTPNPTPTPMAEPEMDCDCPPLVGKPTINFPQPPQPPAISFKRPISQLGDSQTITGTDNNDIIASTSGNQKILGLKGNDWLLGQGGADEIHGDGGNDTLLGGTSPDIIYGGKQNDLIYGGKGNDWIAGELGSDTIFGGQGADTILGDTGQNNSQNPQNAGDLIFGGDGADIINGNEGDDTIHGGKGNDLLFGGKGNDLIFGELGNNTLLGGQGDDSLFGGNRDNNLSNNQGRNLLYGGDGNDLLRGYKNGDTLIGGKGDDLIYGGKGNDLIFGQLGNNTLYGGSGNDTILGNSGSSNAAGKSAEQNLIFGGIGNDIIGGGNGDDTIHAGKGNDYVWGGKGNDLIWGDLGNDTLTGGNGNDTIYGGSQEPLTKDLNGNDLLFGGKGSDWLFGMEGNDTLSGGKGNDILNGGKGNDLIYGDKGNDLIYGGDGNDTLYGGEGNDTIFGDRSDNKGVSVGANGQQDYICGGAGDDLLYGNEGQDTLYGGTGNDTLYGGKDNDLLFGGAGDDWLRGGSGDNTLSGGGGSDKFILGVDGFNTILDFEVGIDQLVLTGGLTFQQLQFTLTQNGTLLRVAGTGQVLANLVGINGAIGSSDFLSSNILRAEG
jgi:uncharacterized repeat protein (TIGR01451 family)